MMVSSMVEGWGEARVAERTKRRKRQVRWATAGVIALVAGIPFFDGFVDGLMGRESARMSSDAYMAIGAAVLGLVVLLGIAIWREADEVQRRTATDSVAVAGAAAFLLYPLLRMAPALAFMADAGETTWWGALAIGLIVYAIQRVRGCAR